MPFALLIAAMAVLITVDVLDLSLGEDTRTLLRLTVDGALVATGFWVGRRGIPKPIPASERDTKPLE